ncbi:MAG: type I secretion protein TolC [Geminicoccaceae bacterium]|nr:MAG: type I secretion protein TolC [Geminicoccaceae bacterium]
MEKRRSFGAGLRALGLAFLLSTTAIATSQAQSLDEALIHAYETNPRLLAARAQLRAVDEQVSQAYARYRPNVFIDGTAEGRTVDSSTGSFQIWTNAIGLNLRQNLYEGGRTVAGIRSAVQQVGQQRAVLTSIEQEIFLNTVRAYTDVVASRRVVELAGTNQERLERQLQATRDRFEVGEVTRTDVAQAEARVAGSIADRIRAEGNFQQAIANFEAVVGLRPTNLTSDEVTIQPPPSLTTAQSRAENNPALIAAEFAFEAAQADVRVAQGALLPTLDLDAGLRYVDNPSRVLNYQTDARIGAVLTIPLYQGGAEYSRVRQSRQIVDQRRREFDATRRDVIELTTAAWEGLQTATAQTRALEQQVRANTLALEGVQTEAQVGARTVLDVLDAEQELFQSEVDLVNARANRVVALYTLQSAIGELTAEALGLTVDRYDPSVHYQTVRTQAFGTEAGTNRTVFQDIDFREEWGLRRPPE